MLNGTSVQRPPQSQPQPAPVDPVPTKRDLTSWWKQFKKNSKREEEKVEATPPLTGIFGVPLSSSIRYANVAISLFDANGESFIYGYVPIVVAKCGVYLKEKATDVAGIFRVAGAERRIKELQAIFNSPDRYGKGLDWTGYTVHDAANILRRYLNLLPEPIIPLEFYDRFREPLRHHQAQAVGEMDQQQEVSGDFDPDATIRSYQQLITELPPLNRQLLLYILDLLAVFASKSDANLMPAPNLSAIFQPGLLSHPSHDMAPPEYRLSQDVLIFLIENQDNFLVGMQGTAADEKTIQEVQSGGPSPGAPGSPTTPKGRTQQLVGRSASNASAGSETLRRHGGVRRNLSVNSKHSRQSNGAPSPVEVTPASPLTPSNKSGSVHRSNTVPSRKSNSPALPSSERFQSAKGPESPSAAPTIGIPVVASPLSSGPRTPNATIETPSKPSVPSPQRSPALTPRFGRKGRSLTPTSEHEATKDGSLAVDAPPGPGSPTGNTSRERGFSSFFRKSSPSTERDRSEGRKPKKLQKRRPQEGSLTGSISQASLSGGSHPPSPGFPPLSGSVDASHSYLEAHNGEPSALPQTANSQTESFRTAQEEGITSAAGDLNQPVGHERPGNNMLTPNTAAQTMALRDMPQRASGITLKPDHSRSGSVASRSTLNELSAAENEEDNANPETKEKRHHRWRLSMPTKKPETKTGSDTNLAVAGTDSSLGVEPTYSSTGSRTKPRKSFTDDSNQSGSASQPLSGSDSEDHAGVERPTEKRGLTGWFKGKLQERKEREAEKERAKSPPPTNHSTVQSASKQSLGAVVAVEQEAQSTARIRSDSPVEPATTQSPSVPADGISRPLAGEQ